MDRRKYAAAAIWSMAMLSLILDSKTALSGASEGVMLCLKVVIPSLFPMMVAATLLAGALPAQKLRLPFLQDHEAPLMITGLLGGYPVGAATVADAYKQRRLSKKSASRLLSFCNNAGPAFIFGMGMSLFDSPLPGLVSWVIQILSALAVAAVTPRTEDEADSFCTTQTREVIGGCVRKMGLVCGWVVIFRVILAFLQRWVLWSLPAAVVTMLTGILELTNGVCALTTIGDERLRFLMFNAMLCFGGVCVHMQTVSVCEQLPTKTYLTGKLKQTGFALAMSAIAAILLYGGNCL